MKIIFILGLLSISLFSQIEVRATNSLYPKGNGWADSVSIRESSTIFPTIGLDTWQVRSTVNLDTLYSNYVAFDKKYNQVRVFGNTYVDSVGIAPNDHDVRLDIGFYYGTGGFPDITGIEWVEIVNIITNESSFDVVLTDSLNIRLPQRIFFRFREVKPQRNHYNLTLIIKKEN